MTIGDDVERKCARLFRHPLAVGHKRAISILQLDTKNDVPKFAITQTCDHTTLATLIVAHQRERNRDASRVVGKQTPIAVAPLDRPTAVVIVKWAQTRARSGRTQTKVRMRAAI